MRNSKSIKCAVQKPEAGGARLLQGSERGTFVGRRGWLRQGRVGRLGGKRDVRHTSRRLLGVQKEIREVYSLDIPPWSWSTEHLPCVRHCCRRWGCVHVAALPEVSSYIPSVHDACAYRISGDERICRKLFPKNICFFLCCVLYTVIGIA